MKRFKVGNKYILLDTEDYKFVTRFSWCLAFSPDRKLVYARNRRLGLMHRFLTGYPRKTVDHKNGNGLDNRLDNLRLCTHQENMRNKRQPKNKHKGVFARRNAHTTSYFAYIKVAEKQLHLGTFKTASAAALAYNKAAEKHFGAFARMNRVGK